MSRKKSLSLGSFSPRLRRKSSSPRDKNKNDILSPRNRKSKDNSPRYESPRGLLKSSPGRKSKDNSPRYDSPRYVSPRTPRFEDFEKIRKLGKGGSGSNVWKVRLKNGLDCCMKEMINPHTDTVEEFENEVKTLKKVQCCNNLIRFIAFTKNLTTLRLFTSLYDGTLYKLINDIDFFEAEVIAEYMYQLSSALSILHNRRIIHRDIKTANIFYDRLEGNKIRLVIGDFGEAKILSKKSLASTCRGTPVFSAPEVLSAKETGAYTFAADIWSLGMVMYELMTRHQPYNEAEGFGYIYKIQKGILPTVDTVNERYNSKYNDLIPLWLDLLSFDPGDRPGAGSLMMRLKGLESTWSKK